MRISSWLPEHNVYVAWALALASTLGSLYFSEILKIPPCVLCWYQRIFMYPLVVILGVGILRREKDVWAYALPLSIIGFGVALYQNLLVWHVVKESLAPCTLGVSCVEQTFITLNFITIPLLSLVAFTFITILMLIYRGAHKNG
jgi:disulfide bond formation protein DsbB